jgi:hypothetical protein
MSREPEPSRRGVFRLADAPPAILQLPEPLRSKALEAANHLLEENPQLDADTVVRLAVEQAHEFKVTRIPFAEEDEPHHE